MNEKEKGFNIDRELDGHDTNSNFNLDALRKKVELLCNTFFALSSYKSKDEMEGRRDAYKMTIVKQGIKDGNSELMQILRMKSVDYLFDEIVGGDLVGKARRRGLDKNQTVQLEAITCTKVMGRLYEDSKRTIEDLKQHLGEKEEEAPSLKPLYQKGAIAVGNDGKKRVFYIPNQNPRTFSHDTGNEVITIKPVGRIVYQEVTKIEEYVTKYSVKKRQGDNEINYDVFGAIELDKIEEDEKYLHAVMEMLLSPENIIRKDNMGYIGELQGFKVDGNIEYEQVDIPEDYTAVIDYLIRQQTEKNTNQPKEADTNKADMQESSEIKDEEMEL